MKHLYIPSTATGKTWEAYVYKPQRGPAYAAAQEGEKTDTGFRFAFSFGAGGDRRLRMEPFGRATDKAKRAALLALVDELQRQGLIDAGPAGEAREEIAEAEEIEA